MRRNNKNKVTYILVLLLLGITLGYAYLNTTLNINGTTNITSANWNIYWDNIVFGSNNATDITTPATISSGLTEVTFNVNFKEPGDTYEFTVDAVNDGTIDAMISTFSKGVYASNGTTPKKNAVWLNQAFPASITQYNTPSEALTAIATAFGQDLPFYLKHKIENGIVTESYAEFVVTPEMAAANSGMVPGTYTLRGEKTYDDDTSTWLVGDDYISPYYEANKEVLKTAFGYSTNSGRCREYGTGRSSSFDCEVSGLGAYVSADGFVRAAIPNDLICDVRRNGSSFCG